MRVVISKLPFQNPHETNSWNFRGTWPAKWIALAADQRPPFVCAFRRHFSIESPATVRIHVTADERYELFLDGFRIGRGPERGDPDGWFFETHDLNLTPGGHVLVARVWALGDLAPTAQTSLRPGFLLAAEGEHGSALSTGIAPWEALRIEGFEFVTRLWTGFVGPRFVIDGARFPWGFEKGRADGWAAPIVLHPGINADTANNHPPIHLLRPAMLPAMLDDTHSIGKVRIVESFDADASATHALRVDPSRNIVAEQRVWHFLLQAVASVTVLPHSKRRAIIDLKTYFCACPSITITGGAGASVRVGFAETLFVEPLGDRRWPDFRKDNRDVIDGKYFIAAHDVFRPDGGASRRFEPLWWQAGRYVEIVVETAAEPLTIDALTFIETRYPLEMTSAFSADDTRLGKVIPPALRALQMCAHETYFDCPHYEQLMYVGDTRLQVLTTYVLTADDRLPRKALATFDASRRRGGLTQSRYPSRVTQWIPPFSLFWVLMIHDFARWRDDPAFVRSLLPGARAVVETFLAHRDQATGLIPAPDGWNFYDWVDAWKNAGMPPGAEFAVNAHLNWHLVLTLARLSELEHAFGSPELGLRYDHLADGLARACDAFWSEPRGLVADTPDHTTFSEHAQCLAILSGRLDPARQTRAIEGLFSAPDLARTTIYFLHYLFEVCHIAARIDVLLSRMQLWFDLPRLGLVTTPERPEPTRSDCHAWGAHPIYHYFATLAGARPAGWGFSSVQIAPQLADMNSLQFSLPHPRGLIGASLVREAGRLRGTIELPDSITGTARWNGATMPLTSGLNVVNLG